MLPAESHGWVLFFHGFLSMSWNFSSWEFQRIPGAEGFLGMLGRALDLFQPRNSWRAEPEGTSQKSWKQLLGKLPSPSFPNLQHSI